MRPRICALLLMMGLNPSAAAAGIEDLAWMVGSWTGTLGPQTVEEAWISPKAGTMATLVRLSSAGTTHMIELIVIREENDTLMLHLRQFSPSLELRLTQNMRLLELTGRSVRFIAKQGAAIKELAYHRESIDRFRVDVTVASGAVLTAKLGLAATVEK